MESQVRSSPHAKIFRSDSCLGCGMGRMRCATNEHSEGIARLARKASLARIACDFKCDAMLNVKETIASTVADYGDSPIQQPRSIL
jgi:hypothetical protein